MRTALSAALLAALWLAPASARADQPEPTPAQIEEAKAHFARARQHLDAEAYDQAIAEYQAAYRLYPDPEFLYNIGEAYRLQGDQRQAADHFRRYLELEPDGRGADDARAALAELDPGPAEGPREPPPADPTGPAVAAAPAVAPAAPSTLVERPLQLRRGQIEAAAAVRALTGSYWDGSEWRYGTAKWGTAAVTARYGVTDRIQVGVDLPLVAYLPDKPELADIPRYGAIAQLAYLAHPVISARVALGVADRRLLVRNRWQLPPVEDELRFGGAFRALVAKRLGQLRLAAEPGLAFQIGSWVDPESSCPDEDDPGCWTTVLALHLPVAAHYQIASGLAAGLRTGIYSGYQLSFDPAKDASLPVVAEVVVTLLGGRLDLGLEVGYANLIDDDDWDPSWPTDDATFFAGLTAGFRNRP